MGTAAAASQYLFYFRQATDLILRPLTDAQNTVDEGEDDFYAESAPNSPPVSPASSTQELPSGPTVVDTATSAPAPTCGANVIVNAAPVAYAEGSYDAATLNDPSIRWYAVTVGLRVGVFPHW